MGAGGPPHPACGLLLWAALVAVASQELPSISQTWYVNENIVNFYRPTNASERGGTVPADLARYAILVNGSMPGPTIVATVNQTVNVTVVNQLMSDSVTIHWHGIRQTGTPWSDGSEFVSQCPVSAGGGTFRYTFVVDEPGTYWWHSHVGLQMDLGPLGALVVLDPKDPHRPLYDVEAAQPLLVHDWWRDPVSMLKAAPGYRNYNALEVALINGQWGNASTLGPSSAGAPGASTQPYAPPVVEVAAGLCTRLRFINANGDFPAGWRVSVSGHNLTLIALDARNVQPRQVSSFVFYGGNRVDAVLCADQPVVPASSPSASGNGTAAGGKGSGNGSGGGEGLGPGEYRLTFVSEQQRSPTCMWYPDGCSYSVWAVIRYVSPGNHTSTVDRTRLAASPYTPTMDPMRRPSELVPLVPRAAPPPTRSMRIKVGFLAQDGPSGTLAFAYSTKRPFVPPTFPALFHPGLSTLPSGPMTPLAGPPPVRPPPPSPGNSAGGTRRRWLGEGDRPQTHSGELSGQDTGMFADGVSSPRASRGLRDSSNSTSSAGIGAAAAAAPNIPGVTGSGSSTSSGSSRLPCGMSADTHTVTVTSPQEVLELVIDNLMDTPHPFHLHGGGFLVLGTGVYAEAGWLGDIDNQTLCPPEQAEHADPAWKAKDPTAYQRFWGCTFSNSTADRGALLNTASPLASDMVAVPPRGWAVVRISDWHPGVWPFHCHTNHHMIRGMSMLISVLPASRPAPPPWVDTFCGLCGGELAQEAVREAVAVALAGQGGDTGAQHSRFSAQTVLVPAVLLALLVLLGVGVGVWAGRKGRARKAEEEQRLLSTGVALGSSAGARMVEVAGGYGVGAGGGVAGSSDVGSRAETSAAV